MDDQGFLLLKHMILKIGTGTSLVFQWLRIHLPMQGTQVQSLIQKDPTCLGATKPVHRDYWHVRAKSWCCCCWVASVVSDSVRPHRRQPTRLLRPWDSPGKSTGVGRTKSWCSTKDTTAMRKAPELESSPHSLQLENTQKGNSKEDPVEP